MSGILYFNQNYTWYSFLSVFNHYAKQHLKLQLRKNNSIFSGKFNCRLHTPTPLVRLRSKLLWLFETLYKQDFDGI